MPQMSIATRAMYFGPTHKQATVFLFAYHFSVHGLVKRRPARAAVEFVCLIKKLGTTAFAGELSRVFWEIIVGKGPFCFVLPQNIERQIIQRFPPFRICFDYFFQTSFPFVTRVQALQASIALTIFRATGPEHQGATGK